MSYTSQVISRILEEGGKGFASLLAESSGLSNSTITRLSNGMTPITKESLAALCSSLEKDEAYEVVSAACRDLVPSEWEDRVALTATRRRTKEKESTLPKLDALSQKVLDALRYQAAKEPATKQYLNGMAPFILREDGSPKQ